MKCKKSKRIVGSQGQIAQCGLENGHTGPHRFGPPIHKDSLEGKRRKPRKKPNERPWWGG